MIQKILILTAGGAIGTLSRYALSGGCYRLFGASFPFGTMAVNLIGCILVGFFVSLSEGKFVLGPEARLFFLIGFCGAFTTFSTFILETANLLKAGENLKVFLNVSVSVIFGFFALKVGLLLGEVL